MWLFHGANLLSLKMPNNAAASTERLVAAVLGKMGNRLRRAGVAAAVWLGHVGYFLIDTSLWQRLDDRRRHPWKR